MQIIPSKADHLKLNLVQAGLPVVLSVSLTLTGPASLQAVAAAAKHRRGGGGGSVSLSTPNPTNPLEHNNRGVELGMKGLWPQAIQEAEMALEGDPENDTFKRNLSGAHLRYGESLANKKSIPQAIKQYREALYVDPENGAAENGLNSCLDHMGKNHGDLSYRQSLASGAEGIGEYHIAVVEYRVCCHIQDSGINNFKLGRALLKANKTVEGYDVLRVALKKDWPKDDQDSLVDCHLLLADTLLNFAYIAKKQNNGSAFVKRLNNAMIEYRRAVTINPSNMAAVHGLTEAAREAVALQPTFANLLALGSAYLLQADFDHAKVYFEKAWRTNPSSPDLAKARLAFHRAVVETPQGLVAPMRIAETVQKVEDLLAKNPNDPDLLYIVGCGKARIGDTAGAIDALQKALSIRKYDEVIQHRLDLVRGGGVTSAVAPTAAMPGTAGAVPGAIAGAAPGTVPGGTAIIGGANPPAGAAPGAPGAPAGNAAAYANIDNLIKGSQFDPAAKACDDVLNATPADGLAWYLKGVVMEKKGDLDEAAVPSPKTTLMAPPNF
jgi:tetratricopeptide (TPR) repeat protein